MFFSNSNSFKFVRYAEKKLNSCVNYAYSGTDEPPVKALLALGVDTEFDHAISLLGDTAKSKPKPVIDSVMFWRKTKATAAVAANDLLTETLAKYSQTTLDQKASAEIEHLRKEEIIADRKSFISIFILCRVLMEIVKKTPPEVLGESLSSKLAEIVFKQLKATDPNILSKSPLRAANWSLFAELLGEMSDFRFASVADEFMAELEKYTGTIPKEKELNVQLVIHGMKYLKVKVYPMDALDESAEFLLSLGKFFTLINNSTVKVAYAQVFCDLLLPVAETATAEFNYPTWEKAMDALYNSAEKLLPKPSHWVWSFSLATAVLSVSPPEAFAKHWLPLYERHVAKFKEKSLRHTFLTSITRLIWVFLFRCTDTFNNTTKKLEQVCKPLIGHGTKKFWTTMEPASAASLGYFIRVVGHGHLQYALESIFFQLMFPNVSQSLIDFSSLSLESIYPERVIISIRAFIHTLNDFETNTRPEFPTTESIESFFNTLPIKTSVRPLRNYSITLSETKDQFCRLIGKLLTLCDASFGYNILITEEKTTHPAPIPFKTQIPVTFHFGNAKDKETTAASQKQAYNDLFCIILESIPWCFPASLTTARIVELLCRNSVHPEHAISSTATRILKVLIATRDPVTIIPVVTNFLFGLDTKIFSTFNASLTSHSDFKLLLTLYIDLLSTWKDQLASSKAEKEEQQKAAPAWPPWGNNNDHNNSGSSHNSGANNNSTNNAFGHSSSNEDSSDSAKRSDIQKLNGIWNIVEEAEGNGLFFLCSQDRTIRQCAIRLLRLTAEFDTLLSSMAAPKSKHRASESTSTHTTESTYKNRADSVDSANQSTDNDSLDDNAEADPANNSLSTRLISFFETTEPLTLFKSVAYRIVLSVPERRRIHKLYGKHTGGLVYVAESDYGVDTAIWLKLFPLIMISIFERFPVAVALCRNTICGKLVRMHDTVMEFCNTQSMQSIFAPKHPMRTHPELVIEQWRMYLIVASTTLTQTDEQKLHVPTTRYQHGRKKSMQRITIHHQKITSARSVFRLVIPLFGVEHPIIRDAVVTSLTWVNINIYKTLLECLEPAISKWKEDFASYLSQPRKDPLMKNKIEHVATEIAHVLSSTAHYLKEKHIYEDTWILQRLLTFLNEIKSFFLSRTEVQVDPGCQRLRIFFAALLESVYLGVRRNTDETNRALFSYEMRVKYFFFIEEWCSVGAGEGTAKQRVYLMKKTLLSRSYSRDGGSIALAGFEVERSSLETKVLSAMATLCSGPINNEVSGDESPPQPSPFSENFSRARLLGWIDATFHSTKEHSIEIACRALKNLLSANGDDTLLFRESIANCYKKHSGNVVAQSYFLATAEVLLQLEEYPCKVWQVLSMGLFECGDSNVELRKLALKLLMAIEKKFYNTNCVRDYEVGLLNNTPAVYKRAMFNLSSRFAQEHPDEAFMVFSEMTMFFHQVDNFSRRDILAVLLPWVQSVELQLEADSTAPSPSATMVMNNLFEITVIFSPKIQNEVEALWVAIGNGKYPGNVKAVLDYIIHHCLERRSPQFVEHVRKILVYLSSTAVGASLIDALVSYLEPKCMVPQKPAPHDISNAASQFPYVSNISTLLDAGEKEVSFSKGQLAVIFLVDILTDRPQYLESNFALLLHVCYVLLDHYASIVSTQSREMLIAVIHCLSKTKTDKADELIAVLRKWDTSTSWSYYELTSDKVGARTPKSMNKTIHDIIEIFTDDVPNLREQWSRVALSWATSCPVRHVACRSFQIFRCMLRAVDTGMLGDMLGRLCNTIADEKPDIQGFAMQILMTLHEITVKLSPAELMNIPQVFWAAVACLGSVHEQEFIESLAVLDGIISKIDLDSQENIDRLLAIFPQAKWRGNFAGLHNCVLRGLKSSIAYEPCLRMLFKLNRLKNSKITGENRLCATIIANIPRFLHALETNNITPEITEATDQLVELCSAEDRIGFARIFTSLAKNRFRSKKDFLVQCVSAISSNFFPYHAGHSLVLLLGFLLNRVYWIKAETLQFLEKLLPLIDLQRQEFSGVGADLVSPLLRLLQTSLAEDSLNVIDQAGNMNSGPLDMKVLKMILGDEAIVREYESFATLFGIPTWSGWAVPSLKAASLGCRSNVHSVYITCSVTDEPMPVAEEFQFHREEIVNPHRHHHRHDIADSISIPSASDPGTLSHMYAELNTLDMFFAQTVAGTHNRNDSVTDTDASDVIDNVDSEPQIYDKKVSVILNRSLGRTPSSTSFKTSLADSIGNNGSQSSVPLSPSQQQALYQLQMQQFQMQQALQQDPNSPTSQQFLPLQQLQQQQQILQQQQLLQEQQLLQQQQLQQQHQQQQTLQMLQGSAAQPHSASHSDSRYTIGTRFYNHLRRGHGGGGHSSSNINTTVANTSTVSSPIVSPTSAISQSSINGTGVGSVNAAVVAGAGGSNNGNSNSPFSQPYHIYNDTSSESEENLDLHASQSEGYSLDGISTLDNHQYAAAPVPAAIDPYDQRYQQYYYNSLQQQAAAAATEANAEPSGGRTSFEYNNGRTGDTGGMPSGSKSPPANSSSGKNSSKNNGGSDSPFRLELLLRGTPLGKSKKKNPRKHQQQQQPLTVATDLQSPPTLQPAQQLLPVSQQQQTSSSTLTSSQKGHRYTFSLDRQENPLSPASPPPPVEPKQRGMLHFSAPYRSPSPRVTTLASASSSTSPGSGNTVTHTDDYTGAATSTSTNHKHRSSSPHIGSPAKK